MTENVAVKSVRLSASTLTNEIITASDHNWYDSEYYKFLEKTRGLKARSKRRVKTIALYYWRLHDGGTERVTARLANIWRASGYRVLLLTDKETSSLDYETDSAVERFTLPPHRERYLARGIALARILREENVDLFVSNLWVETATLWDLFVAKSLGIPVIIGWHNVFDAGIYTGYDIEPFRQRLAAYRCADLVVSLSLMDQYWFLTQGIPSRVIHNPLTFAKMPEERSSLSSNNIVWVGRAEQHQKRIEHVVRMMALVLQSVPEATLTIVGDGADLGRAKELATALGVASSVRFAGYSQNVEAYLKDAAVHVMTSEFEGSPMVIGEAWSHGVPTVMYDLSYLEFLRRSEGFIAVEQMDYQALGTEVVRVLKDRELRDRLGREARAAAQWFFELKVEDEWKSLFDDLETKDDMSEAMSPQEIASVAPILVRHLSERMYAVDERATRDCARLEATLASERQGRPAQRPNYSPREQAVGVLAKMFDHRPRRKLVPLKTIDFGHIGLGDNLMAWVGLHALLSNNLRPTAENCVLYTPHDLAALAASVFTPYGVRVEGVQPHSRRPLASPVFTPLPPENALEWYQTFVGSDWRMNCFEALDAQKSIPRVGHPIKPGDRVRLAISERILYRRQGWQNAVADYIGYRLWRPLAQKMDVLPLTFLALIKRSLPVLSAELARYIDARAYGREQAARFAIFPAGKSFQAFPAEACRRIQDRLPRGEAAFYLQANDPWISEYRKAGLNLRFLPSAEDLFWVIKTAPNLLTTDSFSSHVAQMSRDVFVLALTRDFHENIVHPGAHPLIVANHPRCAPCIYVPRTDSNECVAKYNSCIAFHNARFADKLADALLSLSTTTSDANPPAGATPPVGRRTGEHARSSADVAGGVSGGKVLFD